MSSTTQGDPLVKAIMFWQESEDGEGSYELFSKINLERLREFHSDSNFDIEGLTEQLAKSIWLMSNDTAHLTSNYERFESGEETLAQSSRELESFLEGILHQTESEMNYLSIIITSKQFNLLTIEGIKWLDDIMEKIHEITCNILYKDNTVTAQFERIYAQYKQVEG